MNLFIVDKPNTAYKAVAGSKTVDVFKADDGVTIKAENVTGSTFIE